MKKRTLSAFGSRRWLALGLAASALGLLSGCRGGSKAPAPSATPASAQNAATLVTVAPAHIGSISDVAQVTGALNSLNDVVVGVKLAGKIVAVYAREADIVRAGQIVAQQDPADLQAQLDQARANLESARTKLAQARAAYQSAETNVTLTDAQTRSAVRQAQAGLDVARQQSLVVQRGARTQERQQAVDTLNSAKADRDSARANRDKARADLKRYQDLYRQQAVAAQQLDQAQAAANSAEAALSAAEARVGNAQQAVSLIQEGSRPEDIRRSQASVEQANQGLITAQANRDQLALRRADLETARAGIAAAQAGVAQSQAAVRLAEQGLNDAAIRSPITGVVAERKVEPGMQLGAGKDVMRIVDLKSVYFDAQLSESQYAGVSSGQVVDVTIDALPGRTFQGTVSKIFPVASSTARSFTVRIKLNNEGNALRPQMFARGQIVLATHRNAVLVPREAVLDSVGSQGRVFLAVNNKAVERKVKLGYQTIKDQEITSGVKAGDLVVVVGQSQLQNGVSVQTQKAGASEQASSAP